MSLETILESIRRDAEAEARRTVEAARGRAAELVAAARAAADARVSAGTTSAEPALRAEAVRIVNATRLRLLHIRAATAAGRSEATWSEAAARLDRIAAAGDGRWRAALRALLEEAVVATGADFTVEVDARDAAVVEPLAAAMGGRVVVVHAARKGLVVRSADGRLEVDATMGARLGRARVELADEVAELLLAGTGVSPVVAAAARPAPAGAAAAEGDVAPPAPESRIHVEVG